MNYIAEYQTLREEIGRYQEQVSSVLEIGVLVASGLLAFSYSSAVGPGIRWLSLLSPSIILIPFVYLVRDRVRSTWIIGRYIELHLEPELGLHWESFNRFLRGGPKDGGGEVCRRFRSSFALTSVAPLLIIQAICPFLSWAVGPEDRRLWLGLALVIAVVVLVEFLALRRVTPAPSAVKEIEEAIRIHIQGAASPATSSANEQTRQ